MWNNLLFMIDDWKTYSCSNFGIRFSRGKEEDIMDV